MNCNRCGGTGFLNTHQLPARAAPTVEAMLYWIEIVINGDVAICDCCGDSSAWYGTPGEHYNNEDPAGPTGPYAYNGGLCECH